MGGQFLAGDRITATGIPRFGNSKTITSSYTVGGTAADANANAYNELSIGPVTISSGVQITVPTNGTWVIV